MPAIQPKTADAELGMGLYLTEGARGVGGTIKKEAEDFVVVEIPELPAPKEDGSFLICRVSVKNWETNRLVRELSRRLSISRKRIGFAGTKDKRGVTTQFMSFEGVDSAALDSLSIKDVSVEPVIRAARSLSLGDLWGNEFDIVVRDCDLSGAGLESAARRPLDEIIAKGGFPNFFGVQRFGSLRPNTHIVGKRIVKKDFEGAVHAYAGNPGRNEEETVREARTMFDEGKPLSDVLAKLPNVMTFEKTMIQHLEKHSGDYIGALRQLPSNMLMMFVHALQGWLFNEIICSRVWADIPLNGPVLGDVVLAARENGLPDRDRRISVLESNLAAVDTQVRRGFGFISAILFGWQPSFAQGRQGEIEREVVGRSGLVADDFVVPEIAECTSAGSRREMLSPLKEVSVEADANTLRLRFKLIKGSYATSLLREITKN